MGFRAKTTPKNRVYAGFTYAKVLQIWRVSVERIYTQKTLNFHNLLALKLLVGSENIREYKNGTECYVHQGCKFNERKLQFLLKEKVKER